VRRNQEIIHNQRDELLQEFPDIAVFQPAPDPYGSLTPAELATFGIGLNLSCFIAPETPVISRIE
jgi:hypothetical protein